MATAGDDELEDLIVERERRRRSGAANTSEHDRLIAQIAAQRGLSEEELGDVVAHVLAEREGAHPAIPPVVPLRGTYRISWPERFLPFAFGALLSAIVAAMGALAAGAAILAICVLVCAALGKRVRRFTIDDAGGLRVEGDAAALDWRAVARVRAEIHAPRLGTEIERAARARLHVDVDTTDGRRLRFARGMFFQVSPVRRPVHHVHVLRYLRARAEEHGFSFTPLDDGFTAHNRSAG